MPAQGIKGGQLKVLSEEDIYQIHIATDQAAHFYHLPFQGGNTCDSKLPDAQMGYEQALHFLALALGGCNIIHVATGNLE